MTIFAHFSDPHLVAPRDFCAWTRQIRELNCKRALALANYFWRRRAAGGSEKFDRALQEIISRRVDFVLITGDLTQVGRDLDYEFFFDRISPLRKTKIPILTIAGNHDFYRDSPNKNFAALQTELSGDLHWKGEPLVIGNIALCPIDGACVTPALRAWGTITPVQIESIKTKWEKVVADNSSATSGLARIAAGHFPLRGAGNAILPDATRLRGDDQVMDFLAAQKISAYFCGHIHREFVSPLPTGKTTQHCAGSIAFNGALRFHEF